MTHDTDTLDHSDTTIGTTSLRDHIESAASALNYYKSPDIDEALAQIDAVLIAASLGSIEHDHVVRIEAHRDHFTIHTEWSARCCAQTSEYDLPYAIVDAANPLAAAVTWARDQAIAKAQDLIDEAQSQLAYAKSTLEKAQALPT